MLRLIPSGELFRKPLMILRKESKLHLGGEEMDLSQVPTAKLVEELARREGVEKTTAAPYQHIQFAVNGPAIVLVVTD